MTLTDLCRETRNYFDVSRHSGKFEIKSGKINLDFLAEGQFFRIIGSVFNDGVHQYNKMLSLDDEIFNGFVWALAIPDDFLQLCEKIQEWERKNKDALSGVYSSESFGGYSYSLGTADGKGISWRSHFRDEIAGFQKI